ncbi:F [Antarctic penguin virus B]|uniref:Fusion glycoprotein F0 n=1 Tax=Antarctic penguin virus B TaxID=2006073 RepID=A0A1Y0KC55_9MONO|nr:F [Antarctic penguin virus B] [Antarctic penguin virus B]ARU83015.1 F [Antarctic penguin virus B] [Antarctic penguin virus B]
MSALQWRCTVAVLTSTLLLAARAVEFSNRRAVDAGFVFQSERAVNLYAKSLTGTIAIKLMPNLPEYMKGCQQDIIKSYNKSLVSIFMPLGDSIKRIWGNTTSSAGDGAAQSRLIGAIIGGVALGVATSAQITAGIAIAQSKQNAENILKLKQAIANTNNAVQELITSQQEVVTALGKIQDYINTALNDTIQQVDCVTSANRLGVELSLYLTQLTTVFSNQIQNPVLTPLSIQALYNIAGGNLDRFLNKIGGSSKNLQSLISSGLIQGQPIAYDAEYQILVIAVSIPSINTVNNLRMAQLVPLSISTPRGQGAVILPRYVVKVADLIEEMSIEDCIVTDTDVYCTRLTTFPLASEMQQCILGNVSACSYSINRGVLTTKFVTVDGIVVANCQAVTCRCVDPSKIISQFSGKPLTVINPEVCKVLNIDQVTLRLSGTFTSEYGGNISIPAGQIVVTGPLDISSELNKVNNSLTNAQAAVDKSNEILKKVNVRLISEAPMVTIIILAVVSLVLSILVMIGLVYTYCTVKKYSKQTEWMMMRSQTKM